jgi:phosphoglycolate phosphatase-like HAD superfamily hydrolase
MSSEKLVVGGVIFDLQGTLLLGSSNRKTNARPRKGLIEGLNELALHDIHIGIITLNTEESARELLGSVGARHFFREDYILGRDSVREVPTSVMRRVPRPGLKGKLGFTDKVVDIELQAQALRPKPEADQVNYLLHEWRTAAPNVMLIGDDIFDDGGAASSAGINFRQIDPVEKPNHTSLLDFVRASIDLI